MEQHPEIIPPEIKEADIIGGDLNHSKNSKCVSFLGNGKTY